MYAENFYIALYDDRARRSTSRTTATRSTWTFPIRTSGSRSASATPGARRPTCSGRASRDHHRRRHHELVASGEIETLGASERATGSARRSRPTARRSASSSARPTPRTSTTREADRDLLAFVGQHIGSALTRVRAIEETRQRNAELALVNEIGQALAEQLDFQAIIELVGERVAAIFAAASMFIALYDPATNTVRFRTPWTRGVRNEPAASSSGRGSRLDDHPDAGRPLRMWPSDEEASARGGPGRWLGHGVVAGRADHGRRPGHRRASRSRASSRTPSARRRAPPLDARHEHGRRPRERPPVRRDEAAAGRDRRSARRSWRVINEIGAALAAAARLPGNRRARRRARPRAIFDGRLDVHRALRPTANGLIAFPYESSEGEPYPQRADPAR